ncbi:Helix-turn-helix domain protein [Collinsella sp. AK_207A]|uniref:helix-turn-helix domain-containing protein n=1 Tax=Collinsella sp. AK_207A TaxID=2650472 RepID=UPI00126050B0|nr:helix-turn-helix domain-containing protein [Collinsella sp. AK_207A]VWL86736.1 Helix-turn-helix domain protein [Collinsella sp. AK_207A]
MLSKDYSAEFKRRFADRYADGATITALQHEFGLTKSTVKLRRERIDQGGAGAIDRPRKNNRYPQEFKLRVVEAHLRGEGDCKALALEHGARNGAQIRDWVKRYREGGEDALGVRPPGRRRKEPAGELPPISWTREMGGFLMRIDLRVKHDVETRRLAAELFANGSGRAAAAKRLSVPEAAVRKWQQIYRAFGSEVLLTMDGSQARYTYEQKLAAARAVVEDGMAKPAAMAEFGIMSMTPLDRWCRLYREGGAEALRPKPKGRPRGSKAKPRGLTREQELEERCRRLETEVAYLKKLRALVERGGL